jgi:hypothetical protein
VKGSERKKLESKVGKEQTPRARSFPTLYTRRRDQKCPFKPAPSRSYRISNKGLQMVPSETKRMLLPVTAWYFKTELLN